MRRFLPCLLVGVSLFLSGCHTGTLPNPNDPLQVGGLTLDNLRDQFACVSDLLQARLARRQITQEEFKDQLRMAADSLLTGFNPDKIDVSKAYQAADVMMNAGHWADAKKVLEASVEWAKLNHNEDRLVNDTLSLARVEAELGDVPKAIATARTVFNARPEDTVPVLFATLYNIVPAARGKGQDIELAKLLEDAIDVSLHSKVDPDTVPGRNFIALRPHHIWGAWTLVIDLYTDAKRLDLAEAARAKAGPEPERFEHSQAMRA